ncbi:hypothetical protein LTR84_000562 [Exophiala bonariae]|uniref:FAD-binding domain-containing protein n=1 Tax=Exophiala bonariae TaxID=1690606 RepID=A0AAV9NUY1_9EURO|nr:hypothetical protein LTR84_000562 [Exophiala bonariae]
MDSPISDVQSLPSDVPVVVVGGGPAGMIAALQLSKNGVPCLLVERNLDTTKWPKMDITNCRSMELLKRLGVDQGLREVGVPDNYSFDVLFSTGLSEHGRLIEKWDLPSPRAWREKIKNQNDGSMPREPYQRCSQAIFEAWLKPRIEADPMITARFGMKFETLTEDGKGVISSLIDQSGERHIVRSSYVIGCDGAGSKVRQSVGITMTGGPVPGAMYLIHFKSRDLEVLHRQGQFWHIFFLAGSVIISQDEKDTWTIHIPASIDAKASDMDPHAEIKKALGLEESKLAVTVDEILVTSMWRPNIYLADRYVSSGGRVFISGDAAHQNIPTGGYGMNTAVGDSFDIGWKVAAAVHGYGGQSLLQSYEDERRPVGMRNIDRSGAHWKVHATYGEWCGQANGAVSSSSDEGKELREKVAHHVRTHDGENKDQGIELGYRYKSDVVVLLEDAGTEPPWSEKQYIPSTWPGARAPHVFLNDGETSIFDLFGQGPAWTLVDFTQSGDHIKQFKSVLSSLRAKIPLEFVHLPDESHVRKIWEREAVLVRPDDHVAWRAPTGDGLDIDPEKILLIVTGQGQKDIGEELMADRNDHEKIVFTGTIGNVEHGKVEQLAAFQQ